MSHEILIREATITDLEFILDGGNDCTEFEPVEDIRFWQEDEVRNLISSDTDRVYIAHQGDVPVGFAIFTYSSATYKITFENCWVDPKSRGRGTEGRFIDRAITYYQSKGARYLFTLVDKDNLAGQRGVEKAGFKRGELVFCYLKPLKST